jgi:hypothetical protein
MNASDEVKERRARCVKRVPPPPPGPEKVQLVLGAILDDLPYEQQFDEWKATQGGRWILERCFKRAAYFARVYKESGQRVSMKLLWELVRYFDLNKARALHDVKRVDGYALNNNFHAHVARHIYARRPDWQGMFEFRELHRKRKPKTVTRVEVLKFE